MRTFGVATLGVFLGLLGGFILFGEVLGRFLVQTTGGVSGAWPFVIGFAPFILAIAGGVIAPIIDQRTRRTGDRGSAQGVSNAEGNRSV